MGAAIRGTLPGAAPLPRRPERRLGLVEGVLRWASPDIASIRRRIQASFSKGSPRPWQMTLNRKRA
jgi:hypothetical protein